MLGFIYRAAFYLASASIHFYIIYFFNYSYISNSGFGCFLANFGQISTWKSISNLSDKSEINISGDRSFSQICFQNSYSGRKIWKRDINKLVQSSWSQQSFIQNFRSVGGSNEEDIFFRSHSVHFSQKLVHNSISSASCVSSSWTSGRTHWVQFIEKQHTRSRSSNY